MNRPRASAVRRRAKNRYISPQPKLGPTPEQLDEMRDAERKAAELSDGDHPPGTPGWEINSKAAIATAVVDGAVAEMGLQLGDELEAAKPTAQTCENNGLGRRCGRRNSTTYNLCAICRTRRTN